MLLQTRVATPFTIFLLLLLRLFFFLLCRYFSECCGMANLSYQSAADWKFGAEQFVKMLPDKVHVHWERNKTHKCVCDVAAKFFIFRRAVVLPVLTPLLAPGNLKGGSCFC
ncbi:uncharacterized protein [Spinacia oleracea]|uniref:Uncharacterized protein isoform X2 n=1 Tax=Spinacia oleracea TaxID=3562 RepID=A0ABM3RBD1_SPIOL|nr:uncharacterized protein LOC110774919 isoform X2 [Spinacia oleracea]